MHVLPNDLGKLATVCATPESESWKMFRGTGGVHLELADGHWRATAMNDSMLVSVVGPCATKSDEYPVIPDLPAVEKPVLAAVIPERGWKEAMAESKKLVKRHTPDALKSVAVDIGEKESVLASTNLDKHAVCKVENIDGRLPDWKRVIPSARMTSRFTVTLDRERLIHMLTTMDSVADDEFANVTISYYGDEDPLVFRLESESGRKVLGAIGVLNHEEEQPYDDRFDEMV